MKACYIERNYLEKCVAVCVPVGNKVQVLCRKRESLGAAQVHVILRLEEVCTNHLLRQLS